MASNNTGNLPHQRGDRLTYRDRNWSETTGRDNQIPAKRVSTMVLNELVLRNVDLAGPRKEGQHCGHQVVVLQVSDWNKGSKKGRRSPEP
jgi:predicted chitinase